MFFDLFFFSFPKDLVSKMLPFKEIQVSTHPAAMSSPFTSKGNYFLMHKFDSNIHVGLEKSTIYQF